MADRVTQEVAEAVVLPTDAEARATQEVAEVVIAPTDADARATQMVAEVVQRNLREHVQVQFID